MTRVRIALITGVCAAAAVCGTCWVTTIQDPGRFIFLPAGDVGLGFRSFAGRLEWIEYASWDPAHLDTPWWSIPWWSVIGALALGMVACAWPRKSRPAARDAVTDRDGSGAV